MGKCPVVAREGSMARWPITANSLPLLNQHMAWHVSERDARGPHAVCHAHNAVRENLLLHTSPCYLACIGSRHAYQTSNPALNPIVPTTSCRDTKYYLDPGVFQIEARHTSARAYTISITSSYWYLLGLYMIKIRLALIQISIVTP